MNSIDVCFYENYFQDWNVRQLVLIIIIVGGLPSDPRTWVRDDVSSFLQWCEREFDLEKIDMEKFQMNGKSIF